MTRTRGELPSIWSLTVQAHGLALRFARLNTVALLCHAGAYLALLFLIGSGLLPHGLESLVLEPPGLAELAAAGVAFGGLTFALMAAVIRAGVRFWSLGERMPRIPFLGLASRAGLLWAVRLFGLLAVQVLIVLVPPVAAVALFPSGDEIRQFGIAVLASALSVSLNLLVAGRLFGVLALWAGDRAEGLRSAVSDTRGRSWAMVWRLAALPFPLMLAQFLASTAQQAIDVSGHLGTGVAAAALSAGLALASWALVLGALIVAAAGAHILAPKTSG